MKIVFTLSFSCYPRIRRFHNLFKTVSRDLRPSNFFINPLRPIAIFFHQILMTLQRLHKNGQKRIPIFYFFDFRFSFRVSNIVLFRPNRLVHFRTSYYYGLIGSYYFERCTISTSNPIVAEPELVQELHHFICWC
jgi:hypothetical protein